ncbi:MAG: glutamine synthetase, partial [Anderseniella sp.]
MPGLLTLAELKREVESGAIDTVIMAQTDMQGRLMGKRFHAQHFLDSGVNETHSCNYLLTVDMEMEPVPGYKSASWEQGYGDYMMKPDLSTLRRIPWLEGTALVLCDMMDHHGHADIPMSPRAVLKKQLARLEKMGFSAMMATELEFYLFEESFEQAQAQG